MTRRELIALLGAAAIVWCGSVRAQQRPLPLVAFLSPRTFAGNIDAFRRGLRELGYVEGQNIALEVRSAKGDNRRLPALAAELAALKPDVIVTNSEPAIRAVKEVAGTIPIVMSIVGDAVAFGFVHGAASAQTAAALIRTTPIVIGALGADPIELGLADSFARPGRNVTGFTIIAPELAVKRVDLVRTAFPAVAAVTVLVNPSKAGAEALFRLTEEAAHSLGLGVARIEAVNPKAFNSLTPEALGHGGAVLVLTDAMFWEHRREIVALVAAARVPALYPEREFADDGGLMAYGPSVPDNFRRATDYIDRILTGANAAELPIQQPVKFDFVVNLKTAKALGLTIPPLILGSASEVIE
jgi:putative ABC transport system substrate-binding protein